MPKLTPEQIKTEWKRGQLRKVYLFDGTEDLLKEETIASLCDILFREAPKDFNYDSFDGEHMEIKDALRACGTAPFLAPKRLVLLNNGQELSVADTLLLAETLPTLPETVTLVIIYDGHISPKSKFALDVESSGAWVKFWAPYSNELPGWITAKANSMGKKITLPAARHLAENFGSSLRELTEELKKAALFVGNGPVIEEKDVAQISGIASAKDEGFKAVRRMLLGALAANYKNEKLNNRLFRIARLLLEKGKPTEALLAVIVDTYRAVLETCSGSGGTGFGFFSKTDLKEVNNAAQSLGAAKAITALRKAYATELDIKTGRLEAEIALSVFLVETMYGPALKDESASPPAATAVI